MLAQLAHALAATTVIVSAAWAATALWYRAPRERASRVLYPAVWLWLTVTVVVGFWRGSTAPALLGYAAAFAALLFWWRRIPARNDCRWADDVARITRGERHGDLIVLHDVRNFDWRAESDYTARWETRRYDLSRLDSVDMILSYWTGPVIAHMQISFGFAGAEHVVFSVEIRRERDEKYSPIGGFFKQFELSIIAADERDAIRLRTNIRGEDAYLYRLNLPRAAMQSLFLGYVAEANSLVDKPRFYNTVTVNCTTLVFQMLNRIVGGLPLDPRLLFSGYLPEYAYRVGGLDQRFALDELRERGRITQRARCCDRSASFSTDIRRGIPALESAGAPPAVSAHATDATA